MLNLNVSGTLAGFVLLIAIVMLSVYWAWSQDGESSYPLQREQMVNTQLVKRGIKDKNVLHAMRKVKRHLFVPFSKRKYSYVDSPLPIDENQTISQPYIVALMTEYLMPKKEHKLLEIGTGSGYQAAVLAELVKSVYTIEIIEKLGKQSKVLLTELGYTNIHFKIGDGYKGWKEHAPYDGIIVTAAPDHIPESLLHQLKDGGRMVIPVGKRYQNLLLITKHGEKIFKEEILPVRFVPMTGVAEKD